MENKLKHHWDLCEKKIENQLDSHVAVKNIEIFT